jgi:enterochelin esterase-like enzyme
MRKIAVLIMLFLGMWVIKLSAQPALAEGQLIRFIQFPSNYVDTQQVDVWLPPFFNPNVKHNLLYMLDGQMLFDSTETWNHKSWDVDDIAGRLIKEDSIPPLLVVAIYSQPSTRRANYFPQLPYEMLSQVEKDTVQAQFRRTGLTKTEFKPNADNFLQFLTKELHPFISNRYFTYKEPSHTAICGSSMGGLISMYALCQYPAIFGKAACVSTHWLGGHPTENSPLPQAFMNYLRENLPNPQTHSLYFDCGDQTLDAYYPPYQKKVDEILKEKGFTEANWKTAYFPGQAHDEIAWKSRFNGVLRFLFEEPKK